ncbi:hypothetical protein HID58_074800 [Brassica napus]|uniref:Uncharacterized protein n=1 Tax=Brassica napus TaxID=3708 RepID=A0ABQ7YKH8_BRANA|nr:hypothetical protein HID58_074800 [Brassica napus]
MSELEANILFVFDGSSNHPPGCNVSPLLRSTKSIALKFSDSSSGVPVRLLCCFVFKPFHFCIQVCLETLGGKSLLMSYFLFFTDAGREGECKQLGHGCPSIRFYCSYQCANAIVSYLNMVRGRAAGLFIEMRKDDHLEASID